MRDLLPIGFILLVTIIDAVHCDDIIFDFNATSESLANRIRYARKHRKTRGKFPLRASDELPVNLIENDDASMDPPEEDLDPGKLKAKLKSGYNPLIMSIEKPQEALSNPNGVLSFEIRRGRPMGMRPKFLDTFGQLNLNDANGRRMSELDWEMKKGLKRKVTKFLWTYSHCPVVYKWRDLGTRFWPRWIREGECHQKERSCSFPPGMRCKPNKSKKINILRYFCPHKKRPCVWLKIYYPIITRCRCSC